MRTHTGERCRWLHTAVNRDSRYVNTPLSQRRLATSIQSKTIPLLSFFFYLITGEESWPVRNSLYILIKIVLRRLSKPSIKKKKRAAEQKRERTRTDLVVAWIKQQGCVEPYCRDYWNNIVYCHVYLKWSLVKNLNYITLN